MNIISDFKISNLLKVMLAIGLFQIAIYYFTASSATDGVNIPVPQPDTLLYCQAAKQICLGEPFVFSNGDKPCTGTTSHIYPFVLAVPYWFGAKNDALLTAGFALNSLFYLAFLACWGLIICKMCQSNQAKFYASLLLAVNGHAAHAAMTQSDTGLFMAVSAALLAALMYGKYYVFAFLVTLSPWCRPEGVILSCTLPLAAILEKRFGGSTSRRKLLLVAAIAIASSAGVFALNYFLTGHLQFSSVANKGYLKVFNLPFALLLIIRDGVTMLKELLIGIPTGFPRGFLFLPIIGSAMAWIGIFSRKWDTFRSHIEIWWCCSALLAIATVAASEWQGSNADRYLAWLLPTWFVFMADGVVFIEKSLPDKSRFIPFAVILLFQIISAVAFVLMLHGGSVHSTQNYNWYKSLNNILPDKESYSDTDGSGSAFAMGDRRCVSFSGIYSPDFLIRPSIMNFDNLKHNANLRFGYLISSGQEFPKCFLKEQIGQSITGRKCHKLDWGSLDRAIMPVSTDDSIWKMVDSLDVGYVADEMRCKYKHSTQIPGIRVDPFLSSTGDGDESLTEVGRAVLGYDSFFIHAAGKKPLKIIMRFASKAEVKTSIGSSEMDRIFEMGFPINIKIAVNESDPAPFCITKRDNDTGYIECSVIIPADLLETDNPKITIFGDRLVLAYWFYQK